MGTGPQKKSGRSPLLFFIVVIGVLIIGNWLLNSAQDSPSEAALSSTQGNSPPEPIEYQIVQEWDIPAGGYGRVIVIDSTYRNEAALRRLGEQLREESEAGSPQFVSVEVYDDMAAAKMRQQGVVEDLPKSKQALHDKHRIAVYNRNPKTGSHEWMMAPDGMEGDSWRHIQVKY